MVNDIKAIAPNQNLLVKFAGDLTLKSGVSNSNSAANEVQSIVERTSVNRMQLNIKKTSEVLLKGKSTKALPVPLASIERKPIYRKLVVVCTSYVFVNSMDCRWIIFIFFFLMLFYLYLHMLWKYGAARIIVST